MQSLNGKVIFFFTLRPTDYDAFLNNCIQKSHLDPSLSLQFRLQSSFDTLLNNLFNFFEYKYWEIARGPKCKKKIITSPLRLSICVLYVCQTNFTYKKISVMGRFFFRRDLSTFGRPTTKIPEHICRTRLLLDFKYFYITIQNLAAKW